MVAIEVYKDFSTHICTMLRWKVLQKWEMGLMDQQAMSLKIDLGWEKEH